MAISQAMMLGNVPASVQVSITDQTCYTATISPTVAVATYALLNTGVATNNGATIPGEWLVTGLNSDYDAMATVISGSVSAGTTGSWLNLATTRSWSRNRVTIGTNTCVLQIDIRRVSDLVIIDTATITLEAEMSI